MDIKDQALRVALERIDADSWEDLCAAVPNDLAALLKMSVHRQQDVVFTHCLVSDAPISNRAIGLGLSEPCTRDRVFGLTEKFVATGMKNFALQISPYAGPAELEQWLGEAGLVIRSRSVKLVRDAAPAPSIGGAVEVRQVALADKDLFGEVSARGFGRPPVIAQWMGATVGFARWRHYLAYIDGQPAGAAAMYIDGHTAWLGIGSTLADYRCQGVQQALISQRLADGRASGVRHFVAETESFNTSCQNLMRAGFQCAYERANYGIKLDQVPPH